MAAKLKGFNDAKYREYIAQDIADRKRLLALYERNITADSPQPVEPVLRTEDDQKVFKLTLDQAKAAFASLVGEADAEFKQSETLAASPQEKAEFLETRGWAEQLVSQHFSLLSHDTPYDKLSIAATFQSAVDLDPRSAERLRERADAMVEMSKSPRSPTAPDIQDALAVYRKSLALERRDDLHISARIFLVLEPMFLSTVTSSAETEAALTAAAQMDTGNAFIAYIQAAMRLAEVRPEKPGESELNQSAVDAVSLVESASGRPKLSSNMYSIGVPPLLTVAWYYGYRRDFPVYFVLKRLSNTLCSSANAELNAGNQAMAERTIRAVITIGKRYQAEPPTFTGAFLLDYHKILEAGYTALASYYRATMQPDDARTAAESEKAIEKNETDLLDTLKARYEFGYIEVE